MNAPVCSKIRYSGTSGATTSIIIRDSISAFNNATSSFRFYFYILTNFLKNVDGRSGFPDQ